jgi:4-hydroxy-3-methylbut-2-enyl diphosphate reductase
MEIIIAENTGLCYGVRRALNIVRRTRVAGGGPVTTLGDLIHNPRVIADLERRGIRSIAAPEDVRGGTVIIRSHGIPPEDRRRLLRKKAEVVDATCPIVKGIQELINGLSRAGREVVLVGNPGHPEVRGLLGYGRGRVVLVEDEAGARALPWRKARAVLSQSTQDEGLFGRVVAALVERSGELSVHNTICRSARTRQRATAELAARVDVMFIVGGKASSNTARLFGVSKRILRRTYSIEDAAGIRPAMLRGAKTIGISGGASTPPEVLREVREAAERIKTPIEHINQREKRVQ